ncbi:GNAT family N-acetyltransferase [Bacillus salitolerans]|uniref:GNAT family N-acetyltransferase n=1 Tax=Bacillus salitolerans TaxID=1437434 RepID=A0ABW4LQ88_9BACI
MNVKLKGNKVILRDITQGDVEKIYYWNYQAKDREHLKWNGPYFQLPNYSYEEFYEKSYRSKVELVGTDEVRNILIIEVDGKVIGTVNWYWESKETNWLSNGIVIFDSTYWSGGYGTEAFQLWTDYIFENMDVVRVGISTWSGNDRMMALARKTGMIIEGRIRKARIVNGEYFDSIKMGMLREEWENIRKQRQ